MSNGNSEVQTILKTYTAGGTIVANTFVKLDSDGEIVECVDGDKVKGVAMEAGVAGDGIAVALQNSGNIVQVRAAAAITAGDIVAVGANGKAKTTASADFEVGQADEGAAAIENFAIVHLVTGGVTA